MARFLLLLACAVPVVASPASSAHFKFRIVGTVTAITANEIGVKQVKDNTIVEMDLDQDTKVVRNNKPAARDQIKVGGSVVIDALGDDVFSLTATEIRLVPPIAAPKKP